MNLNIENISRLIRVLKSGKLAEDHRIGFNMREWFSEGRYDHTGHRCDTAACLGGTISILQLMDRGEYRDGLTADELSLMPRRMNSSAWLGLTVDEGIDLFEPKIDMLWDRIPVDVAVKALENLRDHHIINWNRARREVMGAHRRNAKCQ